MRGRAGGGPFRPFAAPRRGHVRRGPVGVYEGAPPVGVSARQQGVHGHVDEAWVTVIGLAVGRRQLDRLGHLVDVGRRVVAEGVQLAPVEEVELLQQHGTLGPRPAAEDVDVAEAGPDRRLNADPEGGHVLGPQQAAGLAVVAVDGGGDFAAVKGVADGPQPGFAATPPGGGLLVGQVLEGARQVRLEEHLPHGGRPAAWQEDLGGRRRRPKGLGVLADQGGHQGIHGKSVAGEADSGLGDLGEAHGAVVLQGGHPGVRGGGNDAAQDAGRDGAAVMLLEVRARGEPGPGAEAADRHHLVAVGQVEDDRRDAGQPVEDPFEDTERQPCCHAGVDGSAC